jgi:hypothetical protein
MRSRVMFKLARRAFGAVSAVQICMKDNRCAEKQHCEKHPCDHGALQTAEHSTKLGWPRFPCQDVLLRISIGFALGKGCAFKKHRAWTEFRSSTLSRDSEGNHIVDLRRTSSRLQAMAGANSLICIPEGTESLSRDEVVEVQMLLPRLDMIDVFPFTG